MAKAIYVQEGVNVDYLNSGTATIAYGDILVYGDRLAVAACEIPAGEVGTVSLNGVYEMPAETTAAFTVGATVYWDGTNSVVTATKATSGAIIAGVAIEAKAQAAGACLIRIG